MGSFPGSSEIVEASEELSSGTSWGHRKVPVLKLGYKDSLEDDINKLFEAFNIKTPSHSLSRQEGSSPFNKHASKKPITMGMPSSPGIGNSDSLTLKQALRELSLTKASEMAAMKRLSKTTGSPRVSEAGRIKTLYNAVVVEARKSDPSLDVDKGKMVEISLVPEESASDAVKKEPQQLQMPQMKASNISAHSSPQIAGVVAHKDVGTIAMKNGNVSTSRTQSGIMHKEENSSESSCPSPSCSDHGGDTLEYVDQEAPTKLENKTTVTKVCKVRLHTVPSTSSTTCGNRVGKSSRSTSRLVKPVSRNKNVVKKKMKQESNSTGCTSDKYKEIGAISDPSTSKMICQRCHCALDSVNKEAVQDPLVDDPSSPELDSTNILANQSKGGFISDNFDCKALVKSKSNRKSREKGEFSQSSKDSPGECSSSTTTSDLSNTSRSSCGIRPHMSKDFRWEAIRHVQMQNGILGLKHFNLLKKLGCGDIGTVYLAELIGTNCLLAIKVMDNEFLARRKKMPRAQTEREILRMLDHPFLPTLYAQFTSDNLSCLVMEYCPGGDLHVLRQRQPGRCFSEPAARFYVAEVLLALEYLHMLGVIYRDLKPENILVREDGHIMLTDFDLSLRCTVSPTLLKSSSNGRSVKMSGPCAESRCVEPFCIEPSCQVPCFSPRLLPSAAKTRKFKGDLAAQIRSLPQLVVEPTDARSNSFVGTHEYLAPEIIKGDGHGAAVDWWTFGIFLYELMYGITPFKGSNNEETLVNVVLQNLKFPETPLVSFHARDLIKGLLVKEPENRLGSEKGAAEIKQHPFFEGLNWALIRCSFPPEVPEFSDFEVPNLFGQKSRFLECKATGEHLEFELF